MADHEWRCIDMVSTQCTFMAPVLIERDVHSAFHSDYAAAYNTVQEWYRNVSDDGERDSAIKWHLLLHQILFRTRNPNRGGSRANRSTYCAFSKRLELFHDGQFHSLVRVFLKDADEAQARASRHLPADAASSIRKAVSLAQVGECGKAASLLTSAGLGDIADARVLAKLEHVGHWRLRFLAGLRLQTRPHAL